MISDSIPKPSAAMASPKKRRGNRSAKLKQCKLDARREQWLSQVKGKGERGEVTNGGWDSIPNGGPVCLEGGRRFPLEVLELKETVHKVLYGTGTSEHHYIDSGPTPPSHNSSSDCGMSVSTRSSSSSGSSSGCFSGGVSGEDDGDAGEDDDDDDCLDDWETMADELAAAEVKQQEQQHSYSSGSGSSHSEEHEEEIISQFSEIARTSFSGKQTGGRDELKMVYVNNRAWRADDSFRPQSLPNLSKQYSFVLNSEQRVDHGCPVWVSVNSRPAPISCPICCEDLDCTDSTFIPCSCGFRLCLFCHKRILEDDGRCPGCRKQYGYGPGDKATPDVGA